MGNAQPNKLVVSESVPEGDKSFFRIILMGETQTGKTAFLVRFNENRFLSEYKSTIGVEFTTKVVPFQDKTYQLQLWDTAGLEKYSTLNLTYFRNIDCALFMYDVTNLESFQKIRKHIEEFIGNRNCPMFIVGNKIQEPDRVVTEQMVAEFCESFGDKCFYTFVDTKHGVAVDECFDLILAAIIHGEGPIRRKIKSARTGE